MQEENETSFVLFRWKIYVGGDNHRSQVMAEATLVTKLESYWTVHKPHLLKHYGSLHLPKTEISGVLSSIPRMPKNIFVVFLTF